jgi:hypothetical protein
MSAAVKCPQGHRLSIKGKPPKVGSYASCPKCKKQKRFKIVEIIWNSDTAHEANGKAKPANPFALDNILFHLGEMDAITLRVLMQNVLGISRTGGGKTSAVVPLVLGSLFKPSDSGGPHAGGFLFCVKNEDAENYRRIVEKCGRKDDLVEISLDSGHVFNPLLFEKESIGEVDAPNAIVEMFDSLSRLLDRGRKEGGSDSHWRFASKRLLRLCVMALLLAKIPLTLPNLERLATSIPHADAGELDCDHPFRKSSYCIAVMDLIEERLRNGELSPAETQTYEQLGHYFYKEMSRDDQRHKMSIISTFTSVCASFISGRFLPLFNGEKNSVNLADAYGKGTIFLVNIPVQQHHEVGRMGTSIIRRCSMRELERRVIEDLETARPVVFCCDEYAQLADGEYDQIFTSASRSKKVVTFNLCQSVDQIYDVMGSKERAHSLLANLKLKFFMGNDGETAEYASKLIGKRWSTLGHSGTPLSGAGQSHGGGTEAQIEWKLPSDFFALRSGGPPDLTVDAVVFNGGEPFSTGAPYLDVAIPQTLLDEGGRDV